MTTLHETLARAIDDDVALVGEEGSRVLAIGAWRLPCPPEAQTGDEAEALELALRNALEQANLSEATRTLERYCERTGQMKDGAPTPEGTARALLARNMNNVFVTLLTTRQRAVLTALLPEGETNV